MTTTPPWQVTGLEMRDAFVLRVCFADGVAGEVDLRPLLARPDLAGTLFAALRDPDYFAQARIDHGAVTWPNGADLAPDAMHDAIASRGVWQPA